MRALHSTNPRSGPGPRRVKKPGALRVWVLLLAGWVAVASAQDDATRRAYWRCETEGGVFTVALGNITAVSRHEYIADNVARVTEVNVATSGSLLARFYYLEPLTPNSPLSSMQPAVDRLKTEVSTRLDQFAEKTNQEPVWKKVFKNYPASTHAHTAEYRVEDLSDLDLIFKSAETAWLRGRTASIKID
jgi:hypothetical protein